MVSLTSFSQRHSFVERIWNGTPLEKPSESDITGVLWGGNGWIREWKVSRDAEITLWLQRVWGLLSAPRTRKEELEKWKKESRLWGCQYSVDLLRKARSWLKRAKEPYTEYDWKLIFPAEDPIGTVDLWIEEYPSKGSLAAGRERHEKVREWLGLLEDRAVRYPQKIHAKEISRDLAKAFPGSSVDLGPTLSKAFESDDSLSSQKACLIEYVFFRALGRYILAQRVVSFRLALHKRVNQDALLILLSQEPNVAVPVIMALKDEEWVHFTRSMKLSRYVSNLRKECGAAGAIDKFAAILYVLGNCSGALPRIMELFDSILCEFHENDLHPNRSYILLALEGKLSAGSIPQFVSILYWCNQHYKDQTLRLNRDKDPNGTVFETLSVLASFDYRTFLFSYLTILGIRNLLPTDQIARLRFLLDKVSVEQAQQVVAIPPPGLLENRGGFILAVALAHRLDAMTIPAPVLSDWIRFAVAYTAEKATFRSCLETLSDKALHDLTVLWLHLRDPFENRITTLNLPTCLEQMPVHLGDTVNRDVLASYEGVIREIPPLVIYAGTKYQSVERTRPYFLWMVRLLTVFTPSQASAFFAAIPDGESESLGVVEREVFEGLGGYNFSHALGVLDDAFITVLNAMHEGQQQSIFERFNRYWEAKLATTELEIAGIKRKIREPVEGLPLLFAGLKARYSSFISHPIPYPLFVAYQRISPERYLTIIDRSKFALGSALIRELDAHFAAIEDEEVGIENYLLCFTPNIVTELSQRSRNPVGAGMELLPKYGIHDDADLKRIVGNCSFQLRLIESFGVLKTWAEERMVIWLGRNEPMAKDPAHRARDCVEEWVSTLDDEGASYKMLVKLLEGIPLLPRHIIIKVLEPLKIRVETPQQALLEFTACWRDRNFLTLLSRYLNQTPDLAGLWARQTWKKVSEVPDKINVFQI